MMFLVRQIIFWPVLLYKVSVWRYFDRPYFTEKTVFVVDFFIFIFAGDSYVGFRAAGVGSEVNFANNGIRRSEMCCSWPPSPPTLTQYTQPSPNHICILNNLVSYIILSHTLIKAFWYNIMNKLIQINFSHINIIFINFIIRKYFTWFLLRFLENMIRPPWIAAGQSLENRQHRVQTALIPLA